MLICMFTIFAASLSYIDMQVSVLLDVVQHSAYAFQNTKLYFFNHVICFAIMNNYVCVHRRASFLKTKCGLMKTGRHHVK